MYALILIWTMSGQLQAGNAELYPSKSACERAAPPQVEAKAELFRADIYWFCVPAKIGLYQ